MLAMSTVQQVPQNKNETNYRKCYPNIKIGLGARFREKPRLSSIFKLGFWSDLWYEFKFSWQRAFRGYDDYSVFDMKMHLPQYMIKLLLHLSKYSLWCIISFLKISSEQSLDGKLFVEFIALIYLSYLKKQMQVKNLGRYYTMAGLLDKLDVIECFERPGRKLRVGEILDKQKQLYLDLGVQPPSSL